MGILRTTVALVALSVLPFGAAIGQPLSPLVVDWDRYFVEALDSGGQPTDQRIVWLGSDLPAGTHAEIDVPTSPAASHRVRVFAFILDLAAGPR
jgi:hypothetical protein